MPTIQPRLVSPEYLEIIADAYASPESGYRRTTSEAKASYDIAVLFLGMLDELRAVRQRLDELMAAHAGRSS